MNRIWYAGVSASFESVRSVISYNNRLLKQMVPGSELKKNNVRKESNVFSNTFYKAVLSKSVGNCKYTCTNSGGCTVSKVDRTH